MKINSNFLGGGGAKQKNFCGGVGIISGTAHSEKKMTAREYI